MSCIAACFLLAACAQASVPRESNTLGSPDAPVTFIEYSDYQCPFCRRFTTEVLPRIKKEYIDTGKVRFIFKDYPLEIHPAAVDAAIAAHCAGEQGKYFSYHDVLFEKAAKRDNAFTQENFVAWAEEIGLNASHFASCLEHDAPRRKVVESVAEAKRLGVVGTPSFLINGELLAGAQPFVAFQQLIEGKAQDGTLVEDADCRSDEDCPEPRSFPPYCSRSVPNERCITTGTPGCKLPGTADSECVTIITEECLPCPAGESCVEGECVLELRDGQE